MQIQTDIIDHFAKVITSPMGVLVVCVVIVSWAFIAYIIFRIRINPVIRELRSATKALGKLDGEQGFYEGFEQYSEKLSESSVFHHIWHEFDETLIKDIDAEGPVIKNTRNAGEHFTRNAVVGNRLNLRFYSALPNLLTGTGILGTFVGLVAGIWLASNGLASSDAATVKQALQYLLNGASLAFLTSIAGLITSILFSWREKHWIHKLDSLRGLWINMLDARLNRVTAEQISHAMLQQHKQQTLVLQQFTTDLAFQIADAIQQKMSNSFGPVLAQLVSAVEGLREDQKHSNDSALHQMVEKFSSSLTGSAGQELTALGSTLNELNDKLGHQIGSMSERHREIEDASKETVSQLGAVFKDGMAGFRKEVSDSVGDITAGMKDVIKQMSDQILSASTEATERFNKLTVEFDRSILNLKDSLNGAAVLSDKYRELIDKADATLVSVNEANEAIKGVADPIKEAATGFSNTSKEMQTAAQKVTETSAQLSQAISDIGGIQEEMKSVWASYQARFEQVDDSLAHVFQELDTGLGRYSKTITEFISGLDTHTSNIVKDLAGASSDLNEAINDLSDTLGRRQ